MTDYQSTIAGDYKGPGPTIECILDEGATTYVANTIMPTGETLKSFSYATPLYEGQVVALSNSVYAMFVECDGMPVVERAQNAEALVIGTIVSPPNLHAMAPTTDANADRLDERLSLKCYRTALVRFHIPGEVVAAQVMCDGANACVQGVMTTLNFNITSAYASSAAQGYYFDSGAANGVGGIPLHYAPAGSNGDLYTVAVLLTGMLYAVTGA